MKGFYETLDYEFSENDILYEDFEYEIEQDRILELLKKTQEKPDWMDWVEFEEAYHDYINDRFTWDFIKEYFEDEAYQAYLDYKKANRDVVVFPRK